MGESRNQQRYYKQNLLYLPLSPFEVSRSSLQISKQTCSHFPWFEGDVSNFAGCRVPISCGSFSKCALSAFVAVCPNSDHTRIMACGPPLPHHAAHEVPLRGFWLLLTAPSLLR